MTGHEALLLWGSLELGSNSYPRFTTRIRRFNWIGPIVTLKWRVVLSFDTIRKSPNPPNIFRVLVTRWRIRSYRSPSFPITIFSFHNYSFPPSIGAPSLAQRTIDFMKKASRPRSVLSPLWIVVHPDTHRQKKSSQFPYQGSLVSLT